MARDSRESETNSRAIGTELGLLASGHWTGFIPTQRDYRTFWEHVREISNMFKTLKPLHQDDRERLWQKFSRLCEETKEKQNCENESCKFKSDQHRRYILDEAERAVLSFLGTLDELKAACNLLKEAGLLLSKYKHEMFGEHKQECFNRIQEIRKGHDAWWEHFKGMQAKRNQDFQARARANLEKLYEMHLKATSALSRARAHADHLRDQITSAWTNEYRDRASGWLSEEESKISDMEACVERIEGWIRDAEEKLR